LTPRSPATLFLSSSDPFVGDAPAPEFAYPRSWSFAALLAALAMLGPFAIDMYLPASHAIAPEFAVPQIAVQQSCRPISLRAPS